MPMNDVATKLRDLATIEAAYDTPTVHAAIAELCRLQSEVERLTAVADRLRNADLSQSAWEHDEHIVLLNNQPIGATITKHRREFDRWWPAVKANLLGEAAEAAKGEGDGR